MDELADSVYWQLRLAADTDPNGVLTGIRMLLGEGVVAGCAECHKPYPVYNLANVYCSDACRKRASRKRIEARETIRAEHALDVPEGR